MYLEGSDQHRGWFQSSLLESCGTRGVAPFDVVLTHGFVLDENGRKMSKSLGNTVAPQDVIKQSGADILRMWVCASDYCRRPAHRPGNPQDHGRDLPQAAQHAALDARLARAFPRRGPRRAPRQMPELERLMLHRLAELDRLVRQAYADFDYKRIFAALNAFMTVDLSAFYFDIRKDALYCDPISSVKRARLPHRARPSVPRHRDLARADAAVHRRGGLAVALSVRGRLGASRAVPGHPGGLARRRAGREMAQGAHRAPRRHRRARDRARRQAHRLLARSRIRSSTCPTRTCSRALVDVDLAEVCITSAATLVVGRGAGRRLPAARRARASPSWSTSPKARSARAPGRSRRRSAPIRTIPT